jgi:hypothetical protein
VLVNISSATRRVLSSEKPEYTIAGITRPWTPWRISYAYYVQY